MSTGLVDLLT